jgi:hypothetical protein
MFIQQIQKSWSILLIVVKNTVLIISLIIDILIYFKYYYCKNEMLSLTNSQ